MSKNPHSRKYELLYICLFEQNGNTKIEQFYEMILPRMAPRNLRKYFRMYTDTLNSIISYLALQEPFTTLLDKGCFCRHKKVAMPFVNSFRPLSQLFGISDDTFLKCTDVVMDALIPNLHQIMRWAKASEFEEFASEFHKVGHFFQNVIGAIDGSHLEIELTKQLKFETSFINYKQFHSLHVQVSFNG